MFPSPTGVNHYELKALYSTTLNKEDVKFPSPTGVNHYELDIVRPLGVHLFSRFRPQQGLTIMNFLNSLMSSSLHCFRPQQGLTIMNTFIFNLMYFLYWFPSPTGVNHYEWSEREP